MTRHLPEQARREQILSAARRCFIENGYHPTRMDDIARAAGLSKGGVYFHFKSKQEVFESLVTEEFDASVQFLEKIVSEERPVAEKMQSIAGHYLDYFSQAPDAPRFFIVMGEMALRDADLAVRLQKMQMTFIDYIARLVRQGVDEGFLRDVDDRAVAALLKALLDGVEGLTALGVDAEAPRLLGAGLELITQGLANKA